MEVGSGGHTSPLWLVTIGVLVAALAIAATPTSAVTPIGERSQQELRCRTQSDSAEPCQAKTTDQVSLSCVLVSRTGYTVLYRNGNPSTFGGSFGCGRPLLDFGAEAVAFTNSPESRKFWALSSSGLVTTGGDAEHYGDVEGLVEGDGPSDISATPSGNGYWVVSDRGTVYAFGDAEHFGDLPSLGIAPSSAIVGSAPTATGQGYYLLGSDGGVFAFGDAEYYGSTPEFLAEESLGCPLVSLVPTQTGRGYWLAACDGGVFAFGDASFRGSVPSVLADDQSLNAPVVDMVAYGDGYVMVGSDGGVFNFSTETYRGSLGDVGLDEPVVGITAFTGYGLGL